MQYFINDLFGYKMGAKDGEMGRVEDFYFEDKTWLVRYIIVKTGNWLSGRKVLISPGALVPRVWEKDVLPVNLTRQQIQLSPDIDTDMPVCRQEEVRLHNHYRWQKYWEGAYADDGVWGITDFGGGIDGAGSVGGVGSVGSAGSVGSVGGVGGVGGPTQGEDTHLRSLREVTGYPLYGADGEIGQVKGFIADDQTWKITFLVVTDLAVAGGREWLVPVSDVKEINSGSGEILVDYTVEMSKIDQAFDASLFMRPVDTVYDNVCFHPRPAGTPVVTPVVMQAGTPVGTQAGTPVGTPVVTPAVMPVR